MPLHALGPRDMRPAQRNRIMEHRGQATRMSLHEIAEPRALGLAEQFDRKQTIRRRENHGLTEYVAHECATLTVPDHRRDRPTKLLAQASAFAREPRPVLRRAHLG